MTKPNILKTLVSGVTIASSFQSAWSADTNCNLPSQASFQIVSNSINPVTGDIESALVEEVLQGLQGSESYTNSIRPFAMAAAKKNREFHQYLVELRDGLKSPDYLNGTDAEKARDRGEARLNIEVLAKNIVRGLI